MDLDVNWIENFNKKESLYDTFYPKEVKSVRLIFLYINDKNELIYSKKFKYPVSKSIIHKNKFLNLLKKNIVYNNRKFFPESMIQFNMTLNPADINVFIDEPNKFNFFKPVNYMREIRWDETIEFFQSLNRLYIFMKNRTKTSKHNATKRIYINTKKRRNTRRKYI